MEQQDVVAEEKDELYLTFPDLFPTSQCVKEIDKLKNTIYLYSVGKVLLAITYIVFMVGAILLFAYTTMSVDVKNYTWTIICAVLFFVSFIGWIFCNTRYNKFKGKVAGYYACIKVNRQYMAFINAGYDKKEAYKLTLEWLDRQGLIGAIRAVTSLRQDATTSVAMMGMMNMHK